MSQRQFLAQPIRDGGKPSRGYRLSCGCCGCVETLADFSFGAGVAAEQIPKKFAQKGWEVGKRHDGTDDLCPACVNREQEARRRKLRVVKSEESTHMPSLDKINDFSARAKSSEISSTAEPPRQMTREHRRLIFLKLEENYGDEKTGYAAGWTDQRLANDLGVPRAWVQIIREENFGPAGNPEITAAVEQSHALIADVAKLKTEIKSLTERASTLFGKAESVERTLNRVEATLR